MRLLLGALVTCLVITLATGHAIFLEPPSRPTIGKVKPQCGLEWNYDHSALYCGGFAVQHNEVNKGRCGICGDPFTGDQPHQAGGKYAKGVIARSYKVGQIIEVWIDLVAHHLGFFTFAICPHNDIHSSPSPTCFESHQLKVQAPRILVNSTYFATKGTGIKKMLVELPANMTCSQCILQYTYTAGNNWGKGQQSAEVASLDCLNTLKGKKGCGNQETFRGCADICVGDFCPQDPDTCLTADMIKGSDDASPAPVSEVTHGPSPTMTPTMTPTSPSQSPDSTTDSPALTTDMNQTSQERIVPVQNPLVVNVLERNLP